MGGKVGGHWDNACVTDWEGASATVRAWVQLMHLNAGVHGQDARATVTRKADLAWGNFTRGGFHYLDMLQYLAV